MPGSFTPARNLVGVPGPQGPQGPAGPSGGGPHTHPEYEHTHPYAADPHTHAEFTHTHPYASDTHNHDGVYALIHAHPYASNTHNHDAAYSATGHTHPYASDTHNHDAAYAPVHGHPYADVSHGIHVDFAEAADISTQAFGDAPAAGASTTEVAAADHKHGMPANPVTAHESASDPHTGYLKENDPSWTDLTDGGQTTLHSHAGGGGAADVKVAEIDFGTGRRSLVATITDAAIAANQQILITQSAEAATGKSQDENEMDPVILRAVAAAGSMTVYADAIHGPITGKVKVNYLHG